VLEQRLRHREEICLEVLLRFLALVLLGDPDQERARDCGEVLGAPSNPARVRRTVERLLSLRPPTALAELPEIHR
jgi:hypothetical protein